MTAGDDVEVLFGLRLLDRARHHAHCPNYPGVNLAQELWHLQCLSGNESNTLTDAVVKCMKLDCVVPPFPLSQSTSLPMPELLTRASCRKDWERSLLNHPSRPPDDPISQGNDLN